MHFAKWARTSLIKNYNLHALRKETEQTTTHAVSVSQKIGECCAVSVSRKFSEFCIRFAKKRLIMHPFSEKSANAAPNSRAISEYYGQLTKNWRGLHPISEQSAKTASN